MRITIAVALLTISTASWGQDETKKPPYSEPPKLDHLFTDDFEKDSRGDYTISGNKDAVQWKKGQLTLGDGAILQRKLDAGAWVEMELDLEFPELTDDGQMSELKVWLDLKRASDSFVWFRQKREQGKTRSAIFIVNTSGEWNQRTKQQMVSRPWVVPTELGNGKWTIRYRQGLWSIAGPARKVQLYGFTQNGPAVVSKVVLATSKITQHLVALNVRMVHRVRFVPTPLVSVKIDEANKLNQKVIQLYGAGKFRQAVSTAQTVREIRKKFLGSFNRGYGSSLNNLALLYEKMGAYEQAKPLYLESITVFEKVLGKDHPDFATSLNNLALLYQKMGTYDQAEPLYLESKTIFEKVLGRTHPSYANSLNNLALLYQSMEGTHDKAEPLYLEAKAIQEKVLGKQHPAYATSLINLAALYQSMGAFNQAEQLYLEAKAIQEKVLGKKHPAYSDSLHNLAGLYKSKGAFEQAEQLYLEASTIRERVLGKQHPAYANSLCALATLYDSMGAYDYAEPLYLEANAIFEKVLGKQHPSYAANLHNLAGLYQSMEAFDQAEPLYLKANAIREKAIGKQHPSYAAGLNSLAGLYVSMGAYEQAEPLYLEANAIFEKVLGKQHPSYAASLNNLAFLYEKMGAYDQAEPLYLESKTIREKILGKQHPAYATSLNNLALLYKSMEAFDKVEPYFAEAKAIREKVLGKQHPDYATSLNNLATLNESMGAYDQAEPLWAAALQITRENFERYSIIQSRKQQRKFAKAFEARFSSFISNALKLNNRGSAVWNQAAHWKGMSLIRQKRNQALLRRPETRETFKNLQQVKSQVSRLIQSDPTAKGWKQRMDSLAAQEEELEKKISSLAAKFGIGTNETISSDISLPPKSCLVDYRRFTFYEPDPKRLGKFLAETHYLALVLKSDQSVEMIDLGSAKAIESAIDQWRKPIEQASLGGRVLDSVSRQVMQKAGEALRKLVWDPLESHIEKTELIIVSPDAAFGRFPLVALPGKSKDTYLLEERKIVYAPVPGLLSQMLSESPKPLDASIHSLLVGNIDYGEQSKNEKELLAYRNNRILGNLGFSPLANTKAEVEEISKRLDNSVVLSQTEATESKIRELAATSQILHIATHGFFRSPDKFMARLPRSKDRGQVARMEENLEVLTENPNLLSGLALSNANAAAGKTVDEGGNDGILFSAEIAMLPLEHVELAVLSACETSLGTDDNPGEGLIGIQRAFQVAGAKSTVASYWKVDDRATQLLMNKFYENLLDYSAKAKPEDLKNNRTTIRIDALRDAQLWMLNNPVVASAINRGQPVEVDPKKIKQTEATLKPSDKNQRTHPRYWAAFMLSGDWR